MAAGCLRVPVTVGDIYGNSPLGDADDLITSDAVVHEADVEVDAGSAVATIRGSASAGRTRVKLDGPVDIEITGLDLTATRGIAADGRGVELSVTPDPGGDAAIDAAIVVDRSGSMGDAASGLQDGYAEQARCGDRRIARGRSIAAADRPDGAVAIRRYRLSLSASVECRSPPQLRDLARRAAARNRRCPEHGDRRIHGKRRPPHHRRAKLRPQRPGAGQFGPPLHGRSRGRRRARSRCRPSRGSDGRADHPRHCLGRRSRGGHRRDRLHAAGQGFAPAWQVAARTGRPSAPMAPSSRRSGAPPLRSLSDERDFAVAVGAMAAAMALPQLVEHDAASVAEEHGIVCHLTSLAARRRGRRTAGRFAGTAQGRAHGAGERHDLRHVPLWRPWEDGLAANRPVQMRPLLIVAA